MIKISKSDLLKINPLREFCSTFIAILFIFQRTVFAQGEFPVGVMAAATSDSSSFNKNLPQILDLGINFISQQVVKGNKELSQNSNLNSLSRFLYIQAQNDSGSGTRTHYIDAQNSNIDWISYFTHAKYRKWEAEGDNVFQKTSVGIKQSNGELYKEGDASGWRTNSSTRKGDIILHGPNYWQYPKYSFSNPEWNPEPVNYNAAFTIKIKKRSVNDQPLCRLLVTMSYPGRADAEIILNQRDVFTSELAEDKYKDFILTYNYSNYLNREGAPGFNPGSQVQFKVIWFGNADLYIDRIEVYDSAIWGRYFMSQINYREMVNHINNYDKEFRNLNPGFYSRLKYYGTIDEPHSIDCYEPLRKVQEILDSLNTGADLLTHWYPGWDGIRDGDNTWTQYYQLSKPKKLYFWYSPFTSDVNGKIDNTDFTMWMFRYNLQWAHTFQKSFYVAAQAFGYLDPKTSKWWRWKTPSAEELKAETMLALAHGCGGILYELYFSYCYECSHRVEGLVDYKEKGYAPRPIWNTVKNIAGRLKGQLGQTLQNIEYIGSDREEGYLRLYPVPSGNDMRDKTTASRVSYKYLSLAVPDGYSANFHAGLFKDKKDAENNYFLLTNLVTTSSKKVKVSIESAVKGYTNFDFRNVEPYYNFDTTFICPPSGCSFSVDMELPAGEGFLFKISPVIRQGGRLIQDESTKDGMTLHNDLLIDNDAILTINGYYQADANIFVRKGSVKHNSGAKINFTEGHSLIYEQVGIR